MKIEQLIVQFLYTNKKVTLQDIGVFYLSPNVNISPEHDKELVLPENAITFEYNTKAVQDEGLIDFIVQQTRKIKPLATSDLESFTILGRQFMNIGKPLPIEGLGILQKNQAGEYEFIQGHSVNPRLEPAPAVLKEKNKEDIVFTTPARKPQNYTGLIIAIILFIVLGGIAAFYFLYRSNSDQKSGQVVQASSDSIQTVTDTSARVISASPGDSSYRINNPAALTGDTVAFNVVVREYKTISASAEIAKRYREWGHNVVELSKDSGRFQLAIPFRLPLRDTTVVKDSLAKIFSGSIPYIVR